MAKVLLALLALAICHSSFYGVARLVDSRAPAVLPNDAKEYLKAHNQERAKVGVDPLKWSYSLANGASWLVRRQRNLNVCNFANITVTNYDIYGVNQLLAGDRSMALSNIVNAWVDEKKYYKYAKNSCAPDHKCNVYKQVVWRKSLRLGCAQATCSKDGGCLNICLYNPRGNYKGQRPY